MRVWLVLLLFACSTQTAPAEAKPKRWIAGDVHMHVAPPDNDVEYSVAKIAQEAKAAGMEFVVLTPHLWPNWRTAAFNKLWREMADAARATPGIAMLPGIEWTTMHGHFTVAGVDVPGVGKGDFLAAAHAMGAWISVNHPFAVPTRIPGIPASEYNMSYRAWTDGEPPQPIDGVEVWNVPLSFANVLSRPGGKTGEENAWIQADKLARDKRHRVTAVGGTDNHKKAVMATTWVLAESATEANVLEALRTGATCVGGPEAGSLKARGDGEWVGIGGIVKGPKVTLAWTGAAQVFVDGVDQGEKTGGLTHVTNGVPHTYRIVVDASRCGFIYANL